MKDRFLRDLVASASVDRAPSGAKQRAIERLGLEARGTVWPRGAAGALLAVAVGLVVCGLRAATLLGAAPVSALPRWSTAPECARALEAPPGACDDGAWATVAVWLVERKHSARQQRRLMARGSSPPPSATSFAIGLAGAASALTALVVLHARGQSGSDAVLLVCAAGVAPVVLLDLLVLRVHRRASTGLDWSAPPSFHAVRVATKLLGLAATLAPFALAYWVFPEYGDWYRVFWNVLRRFGPAMAVFAILYVYVVDGQMRDPYDAYWQLGRVVLLRPADARAADIANHYRSWLIKAFFLPLFVVYTHGQIGDILRYSLSGANSSNLRAYHFANDLVYAVDVLFATFGYVLSFRVLDSHVRSAEPTAFGWLVALECYQPFWGSLSSRQYLHYDGVGFETWLGGHDALRWGWAGAILSLDAIYVLATIAFGVRFSNLTNRGILTGGPYRFTKHPAYVAKNLSWWFITLPFIPHHGWVAAVKSSLALAGVNVIYLLRAKTEERHLSRDPAYVAYALWMNEHGLLRFLRHVPFVRYRDPSESDAMHAA